jgi:DNA-binding beta-propeller fold protein YncE
VHPSGKFLYVTNITSNNVSTYAIDPNSGVLTQITGSPFPAGTGADSVSIEPLGKFGYVANAYSSNISAYAIDPATGALNAVGGSPFATGTTPVSVVARGTGYAATIQQPINSDGSSIFSAKRGVVPVKFILTQNNVATCNLPAATIAVTRTAGGVVGMIDESVYLSSADSGSNFRIDSTACQYIYNLASSSLGVGVYRVDILISGNVVGSAVFALK